MAVPLLLLVAVVAGPVGGEQPGGLFTLSPSVHLIAFSNYTTNNPLDNLKDFPDTWRPEFDTHEFRLEVGDPADQLAVESRGELQAGQVQVSTSASFSESVSVVHRVTRPGPTPRPVDAFAALLENTAAGWGEDGLGEEAEDGREFNSQLYEVVTAGAALNEKKEKDEDDEQQYERRLEELRQKYGRGEEEPQQGKMTDPLIMLMKIEPHALDLLVRPRNFVPGTMVRLMYERVPRNRPPLLQHLDDPVIEYVPLHWPAQHHRLQNLPMGKYIVCGEAHSEGHVVQANCFETVIDRLDNNMLPGGVVGVICVAIISIFLVIVYAIYYRVTREQRREKQGQHDP